MPFNHTDLPLLPAFSDFPAQRKVGELYCDRSVQIAELAARKPGLFYLGRPRMFGRTFIRCHTTFRHPFNLSWSGKTCDIRRSSKTTS